MSEWTDTCDFFLDDLEANVSQLLTAVQHRYATWDPQAFANDGDRHVAIWPAREAESSEPLTTHGRLLRQTYIVAYWEPGDEEEERRVADEEAAADLLELHEAVRDRFHDLSIQPTGTQVRYTGTTFRDSTSPIRGFVMTVDVERGKDVV